MGAGVKQCHGYTGVLCNCAQGHQVRAIIFIDIYYRPTTDSQPKVRIILKIVTGW